MKYVAIVVMAGNGYSAYLPDLPGCIAAGDTFEETSRLIHEAAAFHLEGMAEDEEPLPEPQLFSPRAWSELPHCHSDRSEAERRNLRPPSGSGLFLDEEATSDRGGPLPVSPSLNSYPEPSSIAIEIEVKAPATVRP